MEEANRYLKEVYWPQHNKRFSVAAQESKSAFVPWVDSGMNLQDILCIQEQRTVQKDNTVSYKGKSWKIPKQKGRCNYIKATVRIHEYADGSSAIFHGPRKLVTYSAQEKRPEEVQEVISPTRACVLGPAYPQGPQGYTSDLGSPALWTCG